MPKWSRNLNHLTYADETIIFTSTDKSVLELMIQVLKDYQDILGQRINSHKSSFYIYKRVVASLMGEVGSITDFVQGSFPFQYLGCTITHERKRKINYNDLINKVKNRLQN